VTLTIDLMTPKVDRFISLPAGHLCQFPSKSVYLFSKYRHSFGNGRTNGQVENIIPPASLHWRGIIKNLFKVKSSDCMDLLSTLCPKITRDHVFDNKLN